MTHHGPFLSLRSFSAGVRRSEVTRTPGRTYSELVTSGPMHGAGKVLGGGLEQLEVNLDLHHVAEGDSADAGRQGDIDAEVLAADLGSGFEAGVTGAARE